MTSATNPSLEDIIQGVIPGMPRVVIHTPVLAYENGAEFLQAWYDAEAGKLDPFVLILEGSIPNEKINGDGPLGRASASTRRTASRSRRTSGSTGSRRRPRRSSPIGTCATYGGIPAMKNNPTGAMGLPDYLGWNCPLEGRPPDRLHPGLPGAARQHDRGAALPRAAPRRARARRPSSTSSCGRRGCSGAPCARAATAPASPSRGSFAHEYGDDPRCLVKLGCKGPGRQVQRARARLGQRHRRLPERRRHLHGLHDARLPRQVHAVHGPGHAGATPPRTSRSSPTGRCCATSATGTSSTSTTRSPTGARASATLATGYQPRNYAKGMTTRADGRELRWRPPSRPPQERQVVVKEMSWDPITRIVGSLGIHTEIDFTNQEVLKCYSTSMIFRGFDIFMKGIDPRDAHFITSRICGICGDNHATCSCLNQNMAYGVKPPKLGDYAFNLAESADYMFDHAIFNDCMANVDFCEQMVKETNPSRAREGRADAAPSTRRSTATGRSPTSCARSTRSPASSTSRRCTWRATRARCTACSAAATRTRRRSCRAAAARTSRTRR